MADSALQIAWWIEQRVRVVRERLEEQFERVGEAPRSARWRASASRARQSCGLPAISCRQHRRRTVRGASSRGVGALEPIERQIGPVRRRRRGRAPTVDAAPARSPCRSRRSPRFRYAGTVAGSRSMAASKRRAARGQVAALLGLEAELVLEEREDHRRAARPLALGARRAPRAAGAAA